MTANGEVQTREEATENVKQLDLFVKVMLLEETRAVLSLGKLCEDHGYTYHWTSGQKPHLIRNGSWFISECFFNYTFTYLSIIFITGFRILCQQIHRKSSTRKKWKYVKSFGETRCMNPQKPKTKIINEEREEVQRDILHELPDWLQEFRDNLVDESTSTEPWGNPEQRSQDTSTSSHELPMEPRAEVGLGSGMHSVYTHFPKDLNCDTCLKTKITRASCRRRTGTVVPRAEHFGDLITAHHNILSEESESRNNIRYVVVVQDVSTQWLQS